MEFGSTSIARHPRAKAPVTSLDPRFHLAAIVDSSDDPIISKDLNGIIMSWNPAATRVFGFSPEEIIGRSILTLIPPELHEEEDEMLRKVAAGQRIDHYETTRVKKSGERFPASVTISPVRDDEGHVIAASKIIRDVSDRRKNNQTRFQLAAIVDSADDAIISKDLNGIIQSWNEGAHRMFGYTAEEIVGQPILRLIPQYLQYEEDEILRNLRAGKRIDHYETTRQRKNGETVEVSVTISPIRDEAGRVIAASKIARDISDRKRIERLLVQSEKLAATGRMAAAIAHEINNPLESLMNLVFLARQSCPAESEGYRYLITAEEELERVSHIARQRLGYYRDTSSPTEVHLHELIQNVLTVYNSKLVSAHVSVDTRFNDPEEIIVSKGEMLQVFSNLIANAVDAMPPGGTLSICTQKIMSSAGDGIQITFRDNGTGIPQENLSRVFEPFFTTKGDLGTGIGLWVAKQIIDARGGQISISSTTQQEKAAPPSPSSFPLLFLPRSRLRGPKSRNQNPPWSSNVTSGESLQRGGDSRYPPPEPFFSGFLSPIP